MTLEDADPLTLGDLSRYAGAFAVGLVLMGFAGVTFWQHAYLSANPAAGSISTSTAGVVVYLVMFLAGAAMAFNGVMLGLARVIHGGNGEAARDRSRP